MIEGLEAALSGRYRIERELGAGGMATVYLADDVRHDRKVALKVLKPELAAVVGAERFLAEIRTTANLQHPHILPLFDSGAADSFLFYVMPYVEGETLRERLDREHELPVDEALDIIMKVGSALQYAHEQGVVHRDIKPANILLSRGQPLVADFGIALAVSEAGDGRITETGLSLGTPHYMSPEQAAGERTVDRRSDVYALGCVLYELLTGEPPYGGPTAQAVLGRILTADPIPPTEKRRSIPVHVEHVVLKSLEKIPADRFGSIDAFRQALSDPGFRRTGKDGRLLGAADGRLSRKTWVAIAALAVAALGVGLALGIFLRPSEVPPPTFRAVVGFPEGEAVVEVPFGTSVALSPDGSTLVYAGPAEAGAWRLWVRRADALTATPLPRSDHAFDPHLSPDGGAVAFGQGEDLRIVDLRSGNSRTVTDSVGAVLDWTAEGLLYYAHLGDLGVWRIPARGGRSERVPGLRVDAGARGPAQPWTVGDVLPGGERGVWTHYPTGNITETQIVGVHLETGDTTHIVAGRSPQYLTSGHLVWISPDGARLGAPFDPVELKLTGSPIPIAEGIRTQRGAGGLHASFSETGDLVYLTAAGQSGLDIVWVDRSGEATPVDPDWEVGPTGGGAWEGLAISPDGTRLVASDGTGAGSQLWIKSLESETPASRLTFEGSFNTRPRWSPDGRFVTYVSNAGGSSFPSEIWIRAADGRGTPRTLVSADREIEEGFISPDGEWVVYRMGGTTTGRDIYALRLGEDTVGRPLVATDRNERSPDLSPDGRWLAYTSDETGQDEIFVRPFPDVSTGKWQISAGGGLSPLWSRSGSELFYVDIRGRLVAASLGFGELSVVVRSREPLFSLTHQIAQGNHTVFDVAPGDDRFIMFSLGQGGEESVVWVRNWLQEWQSGFAQTRGRSR